MGTAVQKKLFTPVQIGPITLKHRVVMPPMSRLRAQPGTGIPSDLQREYYTQRASDGGLIVTEATAIAASARGYYHAPGLYADDQVAAGNASRMQFTLREHTSLPSFGMSAARHTSRSRDRSRSRRLSTRLTGLIRASSSIRLTGFFRRRRIARWRRRRLLASSSNIALLPGTLRKQVSMVLS
jgi:hypothetical protein